jgi:type 1 glutamine amidotransferase
MASFQDWPEYRKIIGAKYHLKREGQKEPDTEPSGYQHDVDFTIHLEDHPLAEGLQDFTVYDEAYIHCTFEPDNVPLLSTDDPTSDKTIGWTRTYGNAKICFIQPGHGASIFSDETYKTLVARAIRWCAGK